MIALFTSWTFAFFFKSLLTFTPLIWLLLFLHENFLIFSSFFYVLMIFHKFWFNYIFYFSSSRRSLSWKKNVKKSYNEKLFIPLPLPHPVQISIIIYNRETEDPIPMETDLCQEILKVIIYSALYTVIYIRISYFIF